MIDTREKVIKFLKENREELKIKEVTIGIDAAIDKIVKVVQSKSDKNEYLFFNNISDFGNHLISKGGMSCGIEINERFTKLGGNAPIMANALGTLNVKVNCVAALGAPSVEPIFNELAADCTLYTIGSPAYTTALEFDDGKIMLGQVDYLNKIDWTTMKDVLGIDKIKSFFNNSDLIGLVNWSSMINFNNILKGILDEILVDKPVNKSQILFFDLADFSKRESRDVCEVIKLINNCNDYYKVILGLNENEAILLYKALFPDRELMELTELGQYLYNFLNIDVLVIHTLKSSFAWDKTGTFEVPTLYVQKPKLSTGGGDNFNAGLCFGQLAGLDIEGSLYTANATAGYYVRNAESPTLDKLIETLENWNK